MIGLAVACLTLGFLAGRLAGLTSAATTYHDVIGDPVDWQREQDRQAKLILDALRGDTRRKLRAVR
jgi:hypothetical protein